MIIAFVLLFGLGAMVSRSTGMSIRESRTWAGLVLIALCWTFAIYRWFSGRHAAGSVLLSCSRSGAEMLSSLVIPLFACGCYVFQFVVAPVMDGMSIEESVRENSYEMVLLCAALSAYAPEVLCFFARIQFREGGIRNGGLIRWEQVESYHFSPEKRRLKIFTNHSWFFAAYETALSIPASQQALIDSGAIKQLLLERLPGKTLQEDPDPPALTRGQQVEQQRKGIVIFFVTFFAALVIAFILYLLL
jgi:hypothetical protein